MGISEEEVKEDEIIQEDFKKAQEIMDRITKKFAVRTMDVPAILFALCLIYCRQLKHHKYEELETKK